MKIPEFLAVQGTGETLYGEGNEANGAFYHRACMNRQQRTKTFRFRESRSSCSHYFDLPNDATEIGPKLH
ncbi:MAG TPA: hypothetical protein VMA13_12720 [Candidatus Saccharimonadales bacterium]|nr:hypothetical protein [Candidatus Saccharimonadales bacterium]